MQLDSSFLSPEFLKKYEGVEPRNKGILFFPVYCRTYSRWLEDKKRRETWDETVARVVEHSLTLYPFDGASTREDLVQEAELMYDKIFHLEVLPAGRSLWVAGTKSGEKYGSSTYNCAYRDIDSLEAFCEVFHLLLNGCGVGLGIRSESVEKLPRIQTKTQVVHHDYEPTIPRNRYENTRVDKQFGYYDIGIGDSRQGWVEALRLFLEAFRFGADVVRINYNSVRPKGERIKTAGGRAPGPEGLREMFQNLETVLKRSEGTIKTIDALDICNFLGKNVIIGGVRRSSQIALGDIYDDEFVNAKVGLWEKKENLQRTMSNNSISYVGRPTHERLTEIFDNIKINGEPGIFNFEAAKKRRPNVRGKNPCSEILLDSQQFCCLSSLIWTSHIDEDGNLNVAKLQESIRLATRIGLRHTNVTVELPEWDRKQKRDRLLGVSMTGIMDAVDACNLSQVQFQTILSMLKREAKQEARRYASELRVPEPLLTTCIKPEGSLSQLATVSSGLHRSYAPYFIRRIRVSSIDPTAEALKQLGVPWEPDQGKADRLVFSFPVKTKAKISANEEPAKDQLDRYLTFQKHYTDHNSSCTLTVGEDEWEGIIQQVYDNWEDIIGCTFLEKYTKAYPQMPYEEITKEKYEELMVGFPDLNQLPDLINKLENVKEGGEEYELVEDECKGSCPVR